MKTKTVAIIGAGPAGIAAAIQLKRYGIDFFLFEKKYPGGLLHNANIIENLPGFPRGIPGFSYTKLLKAHIEQLGIEINLEEVNSLAFSNNKFEISTDSGAYEAGYCIAATGTSPVIPEGIIEQKGPKRRIYYEAADCYDYSGANFAIIGSGDAAFDYALNLAGRGNKINIYIRGEAPKALPLLISRAGENENISINTKTEATKIRGLDESVIITLNKAEYQFDCLLIAIGRVPALNFLKTERDFAPENRFYTAGDVQNGIFRQASIAIADGIKTAMKIYIDMKNRGK